MSDNFQVLEKLLIRKGTGKNPFFLMAAVAIRKEDQRLGILFQHQRKLHRKLKKQGRGNGFFIKQEDFPKFLRLIEQLLQQKSEELSYEIRRKIQNIYSSSSKLSLVGLIDELARLEHQIDEMKEQQNEEAETLEQQLSIKDEQISHLTQELAKVRVKRQQIHIKEMERRVPQFKSLLDKFKYLLNEGESIAQKRKIKQESLYQDFLETNFWMFGMSYVSIQNKPKAGDSGYPDFLLQRADGFNDVVELENPTDRLFIKKKKHHEQSKELKEALAQTMDYVDYYSVEFTTVKYYEQHMDTYKPKGIIVIGRQGELELERRRRQLNSYLHGIEIWTYDDLLQNATQVIALLERGPNTLR